jgi:RNA polymerase sigma-70 factor (ECF subfamily)
VDGYRLNAFLHQSQFKSATVLATVEIGARVKSVLCYGWSSSTISETFRPGLTGFTIRDRFSAGHASKLQDSIVRENDVPIYFEDKELTKRLRGGDERAFNQFFEENFSRLYRFALARLSDDPEAAREIVQGALTKGLRKIDSFRGESALFTWLCVICRREIADWWRKQARYREHIVLTEDEPDIRAIVESLDAPVDHDPLRLAQKHELTRLIEVVLDRLPPKYGDALEWKYIDGHSVREIAIRLQVSTEAAQSLLARAKRSFRDMYNTMAQPLMNKDALS